MINKELQEKRVVRVLGALFVSGKAENRVDAVEAKHFAMVFITGQMAERSKAPG